MSHRSELRGQEKKSSPSSLREGIWGMGTPSPPLSSSVSGLLTAGEPCSGDTTPYLARNLPEEGYPCKAVAHARSLGLHDRRSGLQAHGTGWLGDLAPVPSLWDSVSLLHIVGAQQTGLTHWVRGRTEPLALEEPSGLGP